MLFGNIKYMNNSIASTRMHQFLPDCFKTFTYVYISKQPLVNINYDESHIALAQKPPLSKILITSLKEQTQKCFFVIARVPWIEKKMCNVRHWSSVFVLHLTRVPLVSHKKDR